MSAIGYIVFWGKVDVALSQKELTAIANNFGFPGEYLPKENAPATAFRKAWRSMKKRDLKLAGNEYLLEEVKDDTALISLQISVKKTSLLEDHSEGIKYAPVARIVFDKMIKKTTHDYFLSTTPDIVVVAVESIFKEITKRYLESTRITSDVFRAMLLGWCSTNGVPIGGGGVFFIPDTKEQEVFCLTLVCHAVGVEILLIPQSANELAAISRTCIQREIDDLNLEIAGVLVKNYRSTTIDSLEKKIEALESKILSFTPLHKVDVEELLEETRQTMKKIRRK